MIYQNDRRDLISKKMGFKNYKLPLEGAQELIFNFFSFLRRLTRGGHVIVQNDRNKKLNMKITFNSKSPHGSAQELKINFLPPAASYLNLLELPLNFIENPRSKHQKTQKML